MKNTVLILMGGAVTVSLASCLSSSTYSVIEYNMLESLTDATNKPGTNILVNSKASKMTYFLKDNGKTQDLYAITADDKGVGMIKENIKWVSLISNKLLMIGDDNSIYYLDDNSEINVHLLGKTTGNCSIAKATESSNGVYYLWYYDNDTKENEIHTVKLDFASKSINDSVVKYNPISGNKVTAFGEVAKGVKNEVFAIIGKSLFIASPSKVSWEDTTDPLLEGINHMLVVNDGPSSAFYMWKDHNVEFNEVVYEKGMGAIANISHKWENLGKVNG